jgi:hypothetical protein
MITSTPRLPLRAGLLALALCALAPLAHAEIFMCIDANGRKELTDTKRPGCKPLEIVTAIPAPKEGAAARAPVSTPANFPKVDGAKQKERDVNRRDIIEGEKFRERRKLDELKKEYNNGEPERQGGEKNYAKYQERVKDMKDNITRTEKNIEMLDRELNNIK